nr:hypothetical protein [Tanacetum cinerariifolium]
ALVAQQQQVYHPQTHPTQYNQNSSTKTPQAAIRNRGKALVNSPQLIYNQEPSTVDDETSNDKEIDKLMALISLSNAGYESQRSGIVAGARETVGSSMQHRGCLVGAAEAGSQHMRCLFGAAEVGSQRRGCLFGAAEAGSQHMGCLFGLPRQQHSRGCLFVAAEAGSQRRECLFGAAETGSQRRECLFGAVEAGSQRRGCLFGSG